MQPRRNAERNATQPIAGQPRTDEEDDALQDPESVPSLLTAEELQARGPANPPPRGRRGLPQEEDDEDQSPS